jgi:multidrug transporter EmrE-like cation transporter
MTLLNFILILTSVFFNAFAQIALKMGASQAGKISFDSTYSNFIYSLISLPILAGLIFYAISIIVWVIALSRVEVSLAYPMLSIGYILVSFLAWFMFGESITFLKIFGMIFIVLGVILLAKS